MPNGIRFNRQVFERSFRRSHHASEQSAYPVFKKALNEQIQPVIAYLQKYGVPSYDMVGLLVPITPMQSAYRKVYETVGLKFARITYSWIKQAAVGRKALNEDAFFNQKWRQLMIRFYENESAERISEVTETTKEEVRKLLAENVDLTVSELATMLESASFNRNRALRIARTETTTAANQGAMIGGADSDYEVGKGWLKIADKNTRPSHMAMDSQEVIPFDEKFIVGGELLEYPGDIKGSAKNVIQCRCSLMVIPLLDSDGLPVLRRL